jgi:TctA family transporter
MTPPDTDPHAWLETDKTRRTSDLALGAIMLVIGACALWAARNYYSGTLERFEPWLFPTVVAGLLCLVGAGLLLRAAIHRSPPFRQSRPLYIAIVAVVVVIFVVVTWTWGATLFLRFGPPEFMAFIALELAIAITLAHTSRSRAAGMVLFGLLLSTVGIDSISGVLRFTMGTEGLLHGIDAEIVLVGLFVVGDALVCLASAPLFLRTYTRLITTWRAPRIPVPAVLVMRLVAALALAGACYYAYALRHSYVDVAWVLVFGIMGVAAKIFGWNRFLLSTGAALGDMLEQNIRQTLLITQGDPSMFLLQPISAALTIAAAAILTAAAVHSVVRARMKDEGGRMTPR